MAGCALAARGGHRFRIVILIVTRFPFVRIKQGLPYGSGFDAAGERLDEKAAGKSEGDQKTSTVIPTVT
jgi:hypothetical protein